MRHFDELTERHFNQVEAAHYLNKSLRWLQLQLTGPHPPPGFKIGKSWLFKKSELDRWLEQFRAGTDLNRIADETLRDVLGK